MSWSEMLYHLHLQNGICFKLAFDSYIGQLFVLAETPVYAKSMGTNQSLKVQLCFLRSRFLFTALLPNEDAFFVSPFN